MMSLTQSGGGIYQIMVSKRKREIKDKIPFSRVRKPIPRPVPDMGSKKDYKRKKKHLNNWEDSR
jgi:hypothetical protein